MHQLGPRFLRIDKERERIETRTAAVCREIDSPYWIPNGTLMRTIYKTAQAETGKSSGHTKVGDQSGANVQR